MIYLTGDMHGLFGRLNDYRLEGYGISLTEQDYVIVCGDFGICWENNLTFSFNLNHFEWEPYTILWVQGNHENYDMLAEYPLEEWHGGKVRHIVRDKVILLERGQVFEIDGRTFFTFGGATSVDRLERIEGKSWWPQELPDEAELSEGLQNLAKVDFKVDYVITHCCATALHARLGEQQGQHYEPDVLTDYLEELEQRLDYTHWYFGHYHDNLRVDERHTMLYTAVIPLGDTEMDFVRVPKVGHPRYQRGDSVRFSSQKQYKVGEIYIVDAYGTFGQSEEPSYDIMVKEENCLYKHVHESLVVEKAE